MIRRLSLPTTKPTLNLIQASIQRSRSVTPAARMSNSRILVYVMRRDLRVSDNPILDSILKNGTHDFTHLLPVYVFAAQQIEVSGFIPKDEGKSPYPEARSQVGAFWRCGPHRAKFLAESVWDLKNGFEKLGSGLCIRVGMIDEVVKSLIDGFNDQENNKVSAVWMTADEGVEEIREERATRTVCEKSGVKFKLWQDEKYLIDDRDVPFEDPQDLPDIYTTYRKSVEPLRNAPRAVLPTPDENSLPPFPSEVPSQHAPFKIPNDYDSLETVLLAPINAQPIIKNAPKFPQDAKSVCPFSGGESRAQDRLEHLIMSGSMTSYKQTRNGLLGTDFSTKLSAYLALGCITARQIHFALTVLEDGTDTDGRYKDVEGHGKGLNEGTEMVRFELLWRDYMRLCARKFGSKLFKLSGFKGGDTAADAKWKRSSPTKDGVPKDQVQEAIERFLNGTTGMGLIDASQRELYYTGYTSNRARQNVASFLAKHLYLDWRLGAEWYESMLLDYDVSSNWGNWQYVAGVGNDPRGERTFNPVKQAFDYDPKAEYVLTWVDELRGIDEPGQVFQPWTIGDEERMKELGIAEMDIVKRPLKRIDFKVNRGRGGGGAGRGSTRGGSRPYRGHGGDRSMESRNSQGQGRNNWFNGGGSRGYQTRAYYGRGYKARGGFDNGKEFRVGIMDKERALFAGEQAS